MINRIFQLVGTRRIEIAERELNLDTKKIVVRPEYLSICAADQRYFWGRRKKEVLKKKLPMALIHEGIGKVLYDPTLKLKAGTPVVILPNIPDENCELDVKENYRSGSRFCSSNAEGFMQDVLVVPRERVIVLPSNDKIYVMAELLSVSYNAIKSMKKMENSENTNIGIWGDGNVAYATAVVLRNMYPDVNIYVFGKHGKKMQYFSFVTGTYYSDEKPDCLIMDQCYECVGGTGSEDVIEQMIQCIKPQGEIALMGVSEEPVRINTRMVLEKGICMIGHSRSAREDFEDAIRLLHVDNSANVRMRNILSKTIKVKNIMDICDAFEEDSMNDFKTVMKWEV